MTEKCEPARQRGARRLAGHSFDEKQVDRHRSENVVFGARPCAFVPISNESGPAKWLKNKNLSNHLCDFEPGGREFESLRARQIKSLQIWEARSSNQSDHSRPNVG